MREFLCELTVRSYEVDLFGHVNHSVYLNYLELARFNALEEGGFPTSSLTEHGWEVHVVRVEADYLRPCFQGQRLRIRTHVDQFRNTSMIIAQEIDRLSDEPDAGPAVRARVTTVWVGEDGRPMRIPAEARTALGG